VAEEVWSWWQEGSVHRASWPTPGELAGAGEGDPLVLDVASEVLRAVRKAKTGAKLSQRAAVDLLVVRDSPSRLEALRAAEGDLRDAGSVAEMRFEESDVAGVDVTLAPHAVA
jgi:valyl-tRNA synthetase